MTQPKWLFLNDLGNLHAREAFVGASSSGLVKQQDVVGKGGHAITC